MHSKILRLNKNSETSNSPVQPGGSEQVSTQGILYTDNTFQMQVIASPLLLTVRATQALSPAQRKRWEDA